MHQPPYYINYSKSRLIIHSIVTSKYFDLAIAAVIGLNVVTMAMEFYMMPKALSYALKIFNYFFTAVFIVELLMKLLALGFQLYLKDRWNQLDIGIVALSVIGIIFEELESNIIPINPTIIRVMRVLRIARVLKLLKMAKGIRALLDTVMQALPQVGNLGLLFFLLFFIFAALGVELFGRLECNDEIPCQGLGEHAHFGNFGMAFLTLFRVATGDNWNGIMKDTLRDDCDNSSNCTKNCCVSSIVAPIFFVIFVLMAQFVLVNVVVAVLMKHLEESHKQIEDELNMELQMDRELVVEHELFRLSDENLNNVNNPIKKPNIIGLQPTSGNDRFHSLGIVVNHAGADIKMIPVLDFYDNHYLNNHNPGPFKVRSLPSNFKYSFHWKKRVVGNEFFNLILRLLRKKRFSAFKRYGLSSKTYIDKQSKYVLTRTNGLISKILEEKKQKKKSRKSSDHLCISQLIRSSNQKCITKKMNANNSFYNKHHLRQKFFIMTQYNSSSSDSVLKTNHFIEPIKPDKTTERFTSNTLNDNLRSCCNILTHYQSDIGDKFSTKEVSSKKSSLFLIGDSSTFFQLRTRSQLSRTINHEILTESYENYERLPVDAEVKNSVTNSITPLHLTDSRVFQNISSDKHIYDDVNIYVDDEQNSSI